MIPEAAIGASNACVGSLVVAHHRADEGWASLYYDALAMDGEVHNYYVTIPSHEESNKDLYFTVETYAQNIIPNECTTGTYTGGGDEYLLPNPLLDYRIFRNAEVVDYEAR